MAETNLVNFMLNRDSADTAVSAPAYSLTKVLAAGASVVTPLAALLVTKVGSVAFSSTEIVALIVAVLAFLAVVSTADVVSRSLASTRTGPVSHALLAAPEAKSLAVPEVTSDGVLFEFVPVRKGILHRDGPDSDVQILAGRGQQLLIAEPGKQLAWVSQDQVDFCRLVPEPDVVRDGAWQYR
jgi:hypothetical protein